MIELRIWIDKEDIMHDKGRGPRGVFQEATQATAWEVQRNWYGSKARDPRAMESSILKSVIIWLNKVTCGSMIDFIPMQLKIQSH